MNVDFKLPELGENVAGGDVVSVLVREGDVIAANDGVIEIETDKAVVEIPCPYAGKITKVLVAKGQAVKVGQPVLTVETEVVAYRSNAAGCRRRNRKRLLRKRSPSPPAQEEIAAGPEARRLARELGVDLARVKGTGSGGRITVEDVRAAAAPTGVGRNEPPRPSAESPPNAARASRPCRRASWAKTPTATSAASRCREFAAPSPPR